MHPFFSLQIWHKLHDSRQRQQAQINQIIDPHSSLEDPLQGPSCIDKERCEPRLLQNPRIITEANKIIGNTTNNCKHKNKKKKKNQNKEKH